MAVQFGTVGLNVTSSYGVGTNNPAPSGPSGEFLMAEIHGQFYSAARAGNVFNLSTAAAGTTIPVAATNLVSTFTLWNPPGSGKNVELIRYSMAIAAATTVVSDVSLYQQSGLVSPGGTLTVRAIKNNLFGAGLASVCTGYTAATLVNVVDTNMFRAAILTSFAAVTSTADAPVNYDFNGSVILTPGSLITVAGGVAAQASAAAQSLTFAEWPL